MDDASNVFGEPLAPCCLDPVTGFYRTGRCVTGPEDRGAHVICARVTREFLGYSAARGNDLATPVPGVAFPGLKPGDQWCLCAARWAEAYAAGVAPPVLLAATHRSVLDMVPFEALKQHALDLV